MNDTDARRPSVPYGDHRRQGIKCRECHNIWPCQDRLLTDLSVTSDLLMRLQTSVQTLFRGAGGDEWESAVMGLREASNAVTAWAKAWDHDTLASGSKGATDDRL